MTSPTPTANSKQTPKQGPKQGAESTDLPSGPKPGERDTAFFEDPMIDHLLRAVVTLTQELSVSRERSRTLEALLAEKGMLDPAAIDGFEPVGEEAKDRGQNRAKLINDILGPMVSRLAQSD